MSTLELEHIKHSSSSSNNLSVHSDGSLTLGMLQGNVGIGTTSPTSDLHIQRTGSNASITIEETSASNYSQFVELKDSTTSWYMANRYAITGANNSGFGIGTTSSGDMFQIDTDGVIHMPSQPSAFFQGNDGSWATINAGNVLNRAFTTSGNGAHAHSSITYNQSNGRFTMAKAGKYFVSFTFYTDASANADMRIILRQNGGGMAFNHYDVVSSHTTLSNSSTACLNIAANDYIDFYTPYQVSNYHGPQHSFVSIFKVS